MRCCKCNSTSNVLVCETQGKVCTYMVASVSEEVVCVCSAYLSAYLRKHAAHALKEAVGDRSPPCPHSHSILKDKIHRLFFQHIKNVCLSTEAALESTDSEICSRSGTEGAAIVPRECRPGAPGTLSPAHVRAESFS